MILVTLGTQQQQFTRLLDYIEKSKIKDEIIVQAGHTLYKSKKMKIFDFIDYEKMNEYVKKADLIITHGGTGSITGPLKQGKKVIACARKNEYGEHVDNHQEQIVDVFSEEGYILKLDENTSLDELIDKSKKFKPKKFKSNTDTFISKLENCISKKKEKSRNKMFIFLFLLFIFIVPLIIFIREPKEISVLENRTLNKFQSFKIKDFISGAFQENLDLAFSDQMVLSSTLKKIGNKVKSINRTFILDVLFNDDEVVPIQSGICKLRGDEDYLIYCPKDINQYKERLNDNLDILNNIVSKHNDIDFYLFRIRTDDDIMINDEINEIINDNYVGKYSDLSFINSYDDYRKYFYKSDHHWNYLASYEGYKEIISFLGKDKNILEPKETVCFENTVFIGSRPSLSGETGISDEFCVHKFDYPKFNIKVNGHEKVLGHMEEYFKGNYKKKSGNHYLNYYGGSYGQVIIDNLDNNDSSNILLLVDSMSNATNRLIASSYDKTFIVDLRRYKAYTGKKFVFEEYVKNNNIDTVLFVGNIRYLAGSEFIPLLDN